MTGRKQVLTGAIWDEIQSLRETGDQPLVVAERFPGVSAGQVKGIWSGKRKRPGWIYERALRRTEDQEAAEVLTNRRARRCNLSTVEQVALYHSQNDACYLCENPLDFDLAHVDHVHGHETCEGRGCRGCIRGLTHTQCNTAIGLLGEDAERMRRIATNLERRASSEVG